MAYKFLSDLIADMQPNMPETRPSAREMREAAATLSIMTFGMRVMESQSLVNVAGLALSLPRLVVYRPDAAAVAQVDGTDLRNLPAAPPHFMQSAFLIESPDPARVKLFADVVALGGYSIGADWWLISERYPDGIAVTRWNPIWETGEEVAAGIIYDNSPLIDNVEGWADLGRQAARFAIVLGLLLEAEATPMHEETVEPVPHKAPKGKRGQKPTSPWSVRYLTIPVGRQPAPSTSRSSASPADQAGKHTEIIAVRGHLRYQAHGPGLKERRWIYVESYEARRWVSPGPIQINVKGKREA